MEKRRFVDGFIDSFVDIVIVIGIGKTTICKKLASMLGNENCKIDGFYTEEVRNESHSRIGFDIVLLKDPEKRSSLARVECVINPSQHTRYRVGNYHININNFEALALPVFGSNTDILLIDEIGKMELFSQKFHDSVQKLFFGPPNKIRVIATIPQMQKVPQRHLPLFQKLHADKSTTIVNVTRQNRDSLPEEILQLLS